MSTAIERPLVLGHRGASRGAPENTIAAFTRAAELGADGVELDVHRTADGVLVVHHDADLDGVGLVLGAPFVQVRAARPDVPTLAETLDACAGMR
ncbi:MAG TPA: glycerophosphodiester phosphodiesterase, partial [Acidimicrobiia bacterium]